MGLFQRAIETYEAHAHLVGVYREGHDPLAPIGHVVTSAQIEVTLDQEGRFITARQVEKKEPKIIIPVTEQSSGRTSGIAAHPLCDQLKYVALKNKKAHASYLQTLGAWKESAYSHPFLQAVFTYVAGGTISEDLKKVGIQDYKEGHLVRWRINGFDDEEPACWKNQRLFTAFTAYYSDQISTRETALCMVNGTEELLAVQHPKGVLPRKGSAKLISANDNTGFTYRGRFSEPGQAATVGYDASQKAHNALRWLTSEQGVCEFSGERVFLCWNPQGKKIQKAMRPMPDQDEEAIQKAGDYQQKLRSTLMSLREELQLKDTDSAILASLDAASDGRMAVTYYNEISIRTFLERMHTWDSYCCWYAGKYGIQSTSLFRLVDCAFGTERDDGKLKTDDKIRRQHLQQLLNCKVSGGIFPVNLLKALTQRASMPLTYNEKVWRKILHAACSALQKYRYDTKQGGNEMAWELDKKDRSFQYGRLLAAMDRAEADYYYKTQEKRQTNAIKYMSEFRQRPFYVFERVNRHLHQAYLNRVEPWQAERYERLVGEIFNILSQFPEEDLNKPLEDLYLMGYELQRNAFFIRNEANEEQGEE